MINATAFSIDFWVMMSKRLKSFLIASTSTRLDSATLSAFSGSGFAIDDEPSRLMPSASNEDDMVFAGACAAGAVARAGVLFDAVEIFP